MERHGSRRVRQQQEGEAAGLVQAGSWGSAAEFLFNLGPQPMEWCHHSQGESSHLLSNTEFRNRE